MKICALLLPVPTWETTEAFRVLNDIERMLVYEKLFLWKYDSKGSYSVFLTTKFLYFKTNPLRSVFYVTRYKVKVNGASGLRSGQGDEEILGSKKYRALRPDPVSDDLLIKLRHIKREFRPTNGTYNVHKLQGQSGITPHHLLTY